jgi:putative radical SAM enzyme (TIGR03279 family)
MVTIKGVLTGSAADRAGIKRGDYLIRINGNEINDVLDYRYYITEPKVRLNIHRGPELFDVVINKSQYDDIGLEFETFLMDDKKSCRNKCIFCFIDQLPQGLRESLYFKDDDSRLSFLMGNYITMTNMSEKEINRIIDMRMSPINISVHTTNPSLREYMLNNRFAGECYGIMKKFAEADIEMHCQIVLCKEINDGPELDRTMRDLSALYPQVSSVSIVPAGLTKYRENLFPLSPYTPEEANAVLGQIEKFADECYEKFGCRLFYAADEMYLNAGRKIPDGDYYDGYPQIENGVGMVRSMWDEFNHAIEETIEFTPEPRKCSIATGAAAYGFISSLVEKATELCPSLDCTVYRIRNDFFGENITVAGLLTGEDIYKQLRGKDLGDTLYLSATMLRYDKEKLLDDTTPGWLEKKLNTKIEFIDCDGYKFLEALMGRKKK